MDNIHSNVRIYFCTVEIQISGKISSDGRKKVPILQNFESLEKLSKINLL